MNQPAEKPTLHVELAAWFSDGAIYHCLLSALAPASRHYLRETCAELIIPYHTEEAIYGFTVYVASVAKTTPALLELAILNRHAADLYERYGSHCRPLEVSDVA